MSRWNTSLAALGVALALGCGSGSGGGKPSRDEWDKKPMREQCHLLGERYKACDRELMMETANDIDPEVAKAVGKVLYESPINTPAAEAAQQLICESPEAVNAAYECWDVKGCPDRARCFNQRVPDPTKNAPDPKAPNVRVE